MEKSRFITAEEMAKDLCVSKAHAYKLIRKMNDELENKKNIMRKMLNNSVVFRSYKSLNEFIIDNR